MAHATGTTARTQRLIAVSATCLIGVVTALALSRVFTGHVALWRLLAAAVASALLAGALERRNLLVATILSALALLVTIGLLVFPATTWHGLPTLDTLRAIADAAGLVGQQARLQVAPTPPLDPLLLAALTAIWAAVFSAHALAFRAGSPLLALLPPVALVAFADTVLEHAIRPQYGFLFLAAALFVVFADGLRRVQGWGPVWTPAGRPPRLVATAGRNGRRIAAVTLGAALVAPLFVPGFGSKAILDFSTPGDDVRIDPLVSVAHALIQDDPRPVFTVTTDRPTYYRLLSLPEYDGVTWRPDPSPLAAMAVKAGGPLMQSAPIAPQVTADSPHVTQSFTIASNLDLPWVPTGYPPLDVSLNRSDASWDPDTGTMTLGDPLQAGATYQVTTLAESPSPDQLRSVTFPPPSSEPRYTFLPDDTPVAIRSLAEQWTAGAQTTYDAIVDIQDRLRDTSVFTYDTAVQPQDGVGALQDFLFRTHRGFCQQFAASMAVLLRELGIPARVAVGFTSGSPVAHATNTYTVSTSQAHAWVEVLFPTYGWLAFEPTPGRSDPVAVAYTDPAIKGCLGPHCNAAGGGSPGSQGGTRNASAALTKPPDLNLPPGENPLRRGSRAADPFGRGPTDHRWLTARRALAIALAIGVLFLALVPPYRAWVRHRRLRRARSSPGGLILATYQVFTERAAELGYGRAAGETAQEYRSRVEATGVLSDGHLDRLTRIVSDAAYAPHEPPQQDAAAATADAGTVLRDLRRATPLARRVAGRYRPVG